MKRDLCDSVLGPGKHLDMHNRLGVLVPLLYDAIQERDDARVALYVLWMASRFPEIHGIECTNGICEFHGNPEPPQEDRGRARYLH